MMNTIMIFDDSTAIFERGVGYFSQPENERLGSIEVAFKEVFGESQNWFLKFYSPDNDDKSSQNIDSVFKIKLSPKTLENDTTTEDVDHAFVLLDASWEPGLISCKESIIKWINKEKNSQFYVLVYSAVDLSLALNTKKEIELNTTENDNLIKTTIYNRSDSKWLYRQMKEDFRIIKDVANNVSRWNT